MRRQELLVVGMAFDDIIAEGVQIVRDAALLHQRHAAEALVSKMPSVSHVSLERAG